MQTTQNKKTKRMSIGDILEITFGTIITAILIFSKKVYVSIVGATFINPDVKDFISDFTPVLGMLTGLATLILLIYKIKNARKEFKNKQ